MAVNPAPCRSRLEVLDYGRAFVWRAPGAQTVAILGCCAGMPLSLLPRAPGQDLRRLLRAALVADAPTVGVYCWTTAGFDGFAWCKAEPGAVAVRFARTMVLTIWTRGVFDDCGYPPRPEQASAAW